MLVTPVIICFLVAKSPVISKYCFYPPIKLDNCLSYLFSVFLFSLALSILLLYISASFPSHSRHSCFRQMSLSSFFPDGPLCVADNFHSSQCIFKINQIMLCKLYSLYSFFLLLPDFFLSL